MAKKIIVILLGCFFALSNAFAGVEDGTSVIKREKPCTKLKPMNQLKMRGISRQTRDYSCGAASLSILLHQYFEDQQFDETALLKDIILRLDEKEIESRIKDGFSMLDLKMLALRLGYTADGVMLPKDAIYKLRGPVIILLHKNGIKHFVILKGAKGGKAYIADPISGNYKIQEWELNTQWYGEALIVSRKDFGLPQNHALSMSHDDFAGSEGNAARGLQRMPSLRKAIQ